MEGSVKRAPLTGAFRIKNTPNPWRRLWGMGLATTVGLAIGIALGHAEWGIWAFMGGFTSLYVHDQPYRIRGLTLALVGMGLTASFALGALSAVWWHLALALGFVSAAATYLTAAFDVPLPSGFMFILIACISAALPLHPPGILTVRLLSVLGGAAIAWLVGMSDWLWNRTGPAAVPVSKGFKALARYVESIGTHKAPKLLHQAATAVMAGHRASMDTDVPWLRQAGVQAEDALRAAIALSTKDGHSVPKEWSRLLDTLGGRVKHRDGAPVEMPEVDLPRSGTWERWQEVMQNAVDAVNGSSSEKTPQAYRPSVKDRLARSLAWESLVMPSTLRIGIAVTLSVVIAHLFGISHPSWVPLTCSAVLLGVSTVIIAQRTVQRALGTAIGLFLSGALISLHPTAVATAGMVIVLQLIMLFFIAKNYGISVVFITTMALIIIYFGAHPAVMPMIWARFWDTLLGDAVGVAAAFLLWGRASNARTPLAGARVLERAGHLMSANLTHATTDKIARLRAETLDALFAMRHVHEIGLGEIPPVNNDIWPTLLAIERLGLLVVAVCESPHLDGPGLARRLEPVWEAFARRMRGEKVTLERIPTIPSFSSIEHQMWQLADSLGVLPADQQSKTS